MLSHPKLLTPLEWFFHWALRSQCTLRGITGGTIDIALIHHQGRGYYVISSSVRSSLEATYSCLKVRQVSCPRRLMSYTSWNSHLFAWSAEQIIVHHASRLLPTIPVGCPARLILKNQIQHGWCSTLTLCRFPTEPRRCDVWHVFFTESEGSKSALTAPGFKLHAWLGVWLASAGRLCISFKSLKLYLVSKFSSFEQILNLMGNRHHFEKLKMPFSAISTSKTLITVDFWRVWFRHRPRSKLISPISWFAVLISAMQYICDIKNSILFSKSHDKHYWKKNNCEKNNCVKMFLRSSSL